LYRKLILIEPNLSQAKMDTLRRANLLEVVSRVQQKVSGSGDLGPPDTAAETPIDYSLVPIL
jgi:hypothetical protein